MEPTQRIIPNKVDEQYILPILFLAVNVTIVIWFYLIHEYTQPNEVFQTQYGFDSTTREQYVANLGFQLVLFTAVLMGTPIYIKFRKRWLLIAVTLLHLGLLYYFFYVI